MAVRFYDEALVEKIQKWIKDPNMVILKPNETNRLFSLRADQTGDKPLKLPLIAISRDPNISISIPSKRSLSYDGFKVDQKYENTIHLDAIPIELNYQLDIYTRRFDECDEYVRNFIFKFVNNPRLHVMIPYNGINIQHIAYARIESTVSDNSDIPEKLFSDEFTRFTLQLRIDDAFLFSTPVTENKHIIGAELNVSTSLLNDDTEEITESVVDFSNKEY